MSGSAVWSDGGTTEPTNAVDVLPCAGALGSLLVSSGSPKEAKSVFWTGGAGADGDRVAFKGIGITERDEDSDRVGAVDPERSGLRGAELPFREPWLAPFCDLPVLWPSRPAELAALAAA